MDHGSYQSDQKVRLLLPLPILLRLRLRLLDWEGGGWESQELAGIGGNWRRSDGFRLDA